MSVIRTASSRAARGQRARRILRLATLGLVASLGLLAFGFWVGFYVFLTRIASQEPPNPRPADAIVVLTGGASRLSDGLQLLADGYGRRLLITGVNPSISDEALRRALPAHPLLMTCCVDLGHKALNTWGNAIEAAEWARARKFNSLVVVTSTWHMPRALFELSRILPEVELFAYPVVTERMQDGQWWSEPQTARLLLKEYVKYMMAHAKIRPAQGLALPQELAPDQGLAQVKAPPPPGSQAADTR